MISGMEGALSGDVIGNISNFVDGVDTSLPNAESESESEPGNGMGGGFNLLNPFSWFSGKSQEAIESKDKSYSNKTLSGSLLNRRNATNEAIRMMRGQGGGNHSFVPIGRGYGMGGPAVRVTSNRGMRWGKMHQGTDIAPTGSKLHMPLYLPKRATIVDSRAEGNGAGYGNSIYFTTSDGITHLYAHMKNKSRLKVGQTYPAGTQVGLMGYSGNTVPKGPDGTHLHWETGTNEADVGRAGSSLFNPLSKYSKFAPFQGTPSADGADSDYTAESPSASDYSDRGSSPLAVSAVTSPMRDYATNVRNTGERLQKSMESQGMESGLAASLGAALAPLGNLKQSLMEAVSAGRPAPGGGSDNSSMSADGDVSMFPTSSPVRDGGHVFAGDV
jgi:murein DD-endopeptidase MepM/ murein hydrolase activator NlpD